MDLVQQFNNDEQRYRMREALTAARKAMLECQHNAHKGEVCFDGDEWHLVLEQIDKALTP